MRTKSLIVNIDMAVNCTIECATRLAHKHRKAPIKNYTATYILCDASSNLRVFLFRLGHLFSVKHILRDLVLQVQLLVDASLRAVRLLVRLLGSLLKCDLVSFSGTVLLK